MKIVDKRRIRSVACMVIGHDVRKGDRMAYDPDWCARCWFNEGEINLYEGWTLPRQLNNIYVWLVDREWGWFDALDDFLAHRVHRKPGWWEY